MATSFKRAYAIPKSAALRAPVPVAVHCWPIPHRRPQTQFCLSLCGVPGSWCTQGLSEPSEHLWQEWGLILNANLPLLPSCWGFSFALGHAVSPHSHSSASHLTGVSLTLDVGYLLTATLAPPILLGFLWSWTWRISSQSLAAPEPQLWLLGEIAITSGMQMTSPLGQKLTKH